MKTTQSSYKSILIITSAVAVLTSNAWTQNTKTGVGALGAVTSGVNNTADGAYALQLDTTGGNNTATGRVALAKNVAGSFNTAVGSGALYSNTSNFNTAVGYNSLFANTTGNHNTAVGLSTLQKTTTGFGNTALGYLALQNNISGSSNVAIGRFAGLANTTGFNNIYIANQGFNESSTIRIGDPAVHTFTYLSGDVDIPGAVWEGSGTGTTDEPEFGLVVRRANSYSEDDGDVVAISDDLSLQRDGTDGGFKIVVTSADVFRQTIAAMGITSAGANLNKVINIPDSTPAGTVYQIYLDTDNMVFFTLSFGNIYNANSQTIVTLQRESTDYYWTGTITSTFNQ